MTASERSKVRAGVPAPESNVRAVVETALMSEGGRRGPLLPVLHAVQDRLGHVPQAAVPLIARALGLSRAEVHGVVSFYHDFRSAPPGRHVVRLCLAEACQAMGANRLRQRLESALDVGMHGTTPDGAVTLEPVYCLGNCACAPAMQVDGELFGRVSAEHADTLLAACREVA